ncbi:MAG: hypothetical protein ACFFCW_21415 [Candidatus Hodarchaeota archaeon]
MAKQPHKILKLMQNEAIHRARKNSPKIIQENLISDLFDIDPYKSKGASIHIYLDLDQLEDYQE